MLHEDQKQIQNSIHPSFLTVKVYSYFQRRPVRIFACFAIGHFKVFIGCVLVAMLNIIDLRLGPPMFVSE